MDDLGDGVAFKYFWESSLVDVANCNHIEEVTSVMEHHLLSDNLT